MRKILTIQGGMAVGKTTVAQRLSLEHPQINFVYEKQTHFAKRRELLRLDIRKRADFVENQRIFIQAECSRYDSLPEGVSILDRGPEDIEFYTLMFPRSIGEDWDMELLLHDELKELRCRRSNRILFLSAKPETLRSRRDLDSARRRGSFEHYIRNLYPIEQGWFEGLGYTEVVDVDNHSQSDLQCLVTRWIEQQTPLVH